MSLTALGALLVSGSFAFVAFMLPLLARSARRSGFVDSPLGRKDHAAPTPAVGGVAILFGVAVPATLGLLAALFHDSLGVDLPQVVLPHVPGIRSRAAPLLVLLCGAGLLHAVGYLDDRKPLSARLRLLIQVLCAAAVSTSGIRITLHIEAEWVHHLLTVVFIVAIVNGSNFLDNMNGLCGGVLLITTLSLLGLAIEGHQWFVSAILLTLAGSLMGFLLWNFPKARVFLGDAGSTALGFLLAVLAIALTYDQGPASPRSVLLPACAFLVVICDTTTVVFARLARGVHPFTAGHDHLSHRLVRRGLGRISAVLLLVGVQALAAGIVLFVGKVESKTIAACAALTMLPTIAILVRLRLEPAVPKDSGANQI
jgi:UDP-GlcNAc:undecaprenyl-phosphate GlcNAc-1-phosphate transferase